MTAQIAETVKVAHSKLSIDPLNARKAFNANRIAELAESIAQEGLLQNIVVRPAEKKGHFFITAGGRRFRAVSILIEQGRLPKNFEFECKVKSVDVTGAVALSIAENIMRDDMDPLDQYQAFSKLADEGLPIADIAARFGTTEVIVNRRLRLARVHPDLHAAYSAGKINFETLSAFAISDDQAAQMHVWDTLPPYNRSAYSIKIALTGDAVAPTDKRMTFIGGPAAYEQAGGQLIRDLFSEKNNGFATDIALVEKLVADKIAESVSAIKAEGWAWVEVLQEWSYPSVKEYERHYQQPVQLTEDQQAELDALTAELSAIEERIEMEEEDEVSEKRATEISNRLSELNREAYDPAIVATSGVFLVLNHNGQLRIERGFEKREASAENESAEVEPKAENTDPKLSAAFVEDLTAQKTAAIQAELSTNHDVALTAVVHAMLLPVFYHYSHGHSCLEISTTRVRLENSLKQPDQSTALAALDALSEKFKTSVPENPADLWDWCLDMKRGDLLELLAFAASRTVNAVEGKTTYRNEKHISHANQLAAALGTDMHNYYQPTASNCFSNMNRAMIQAAVAEARGDEFAKGVGDMKKNDAAAYAEKTVKGTGWLPAPLVLSTASQDQPVVGQDDDQDVDDEDVQSATAEIIQFPEAAA